MKLAKAVLVLLVIFVLGSLIGCSAVEQSPSPVKKYPSKRNIIKQADVTGDGIRDQFGLNSDEDLYIDDGKTGKLLFICFGGGYREFYEFYILSDQTVVMCGIGSTSSSEERQRYWVKYFKYNPGEGCLTLIGGDFTDKKYLPGQGKLALTEVRGQKTRFLRALDLVNAKNWDKTPFSSWEGYCDYDDERVVFQHQDKGKLEAPSGEVHIFYMNNWYHGYPEVPAPDEPRIEVDLKTLKIIK